MHRNVLKGKGPLERVNVDTLQSRSVFLLMIFDGFKATVAKDFDSFMYFMIAYVWTILAVLPKSMRHK